LLVLIFFITKTKDFGGGGVLTPKTPPCVRSCLQIKTTNYNFEAEK